MTQTAKLTASHGAAGDNFGGSIAITGNTVVVGTPGAMFEPLGPVAHFGPGAQAPLMFSRNPRPVGRT